MCASDGPAALFRAAGAPAAAAALAGAAPGCVLVCGHGGAAAGTRSAFEELLGGAVGALFDAAGAEASALATTISVSYVALLEDGKARDLLAPGSAPLEATPATPADAALSPGDALATSPSAKRPPPAGGFDFSRSFPGVYAQEVSSGADCLDLVAAAEEFRGVTLARAGASANSTHGVLALTVTRRATRRTRASGLAAAAAAAATANSSPSQTPMSSPHSDESPKRVESTRAALVLVEMATDESGGQTMEALRGALAARAAGSSDAVGDPWGASPLTSSLRGVLGDGAATTVLVCVAPTAGDEDASARSLRFAAACAGREDVAGIAADLYDRQRQPGDGSNAPAAAYVTTPSDEAARAPLRSPSNALSSAERERKQGTKKRTELPLRGVHHQHQSSSQQPVVVPSSEGANDAVTETLDSPGSSSPTAAGKIVPAFSPAPPPARTLSSMSAPAFINETLPPKESLSSVPSGGTLKTCSETGSVVEHPSPATGSVSGDPPRDDDIVTNQAAGSVVYFADEHAPGERQPPLPLASDVAEEVNIDGTDDESLHLDPTLHFDPRAAADHDPSAYAPSAEAVAAVLERNAQLEAELEALCERLDAKHDGTSRRTASRTNAPGGGDSEDAPAGHHNSDSSRPASVRSGVLTPRSSGSEDGASSAREYPRHQSQLHHRGQPQDQQTSRRALRALRARLAEAEAALASASRRHERELRELKEGFRRGLAARDAELAEVTGALAHFEERSASALGAGGRSADELLRALENEKAAHERSRRQLAVLTQIALGAGKSRGERERGGGGRKGGKGMGGIMGFGSPDVRGGRRSGMGGTGGNRGGAERGGRMLSEAALQGLVHDTEERAEVHDKAIAEHKQIINMLVEEGEGLKAQLSQATSVLERTGVDTLLRLLRKDGNEDNATRRAAAKALANICARAAGAREVLAAQGVAALSAHLADDSTDEALRRLAAGALANLAMFPEGRSEMLGFSARVADGGSAEHAANAGAGRPTRAHATAALSALCGAAYSSADVHVLRMVAGALANLAGGEGEGAMEARQAVLEGGGLRALVALASSGHPDVLAQVARGLANFVVGKEEGPASAAPSEGKPADATTASTTATSADALDPVSPGVRAGAWPGEALMHAGALPALVTMASSHTISVKRHAALALFNLAAKGGAPAAARLVGAGALEPLVEMRKCERPDVAKLAERAVGALRDADPSVRGRVALLLDVEGAQQ